ncbi:hypothetical protein P7K49_004344 [Saguinus oedipus]|uniref:Pachytene checkpoint protein 2 homolog n=1 Tax=Saguinus oedipus TaxID=9490 RepID=A0ABQ9W9H9_SAGOE|nr:hypothetical protein P7K49_004344 [Saguinus oedipus]
MLTVVLASRPNRHSNVVILTTSNITEKIDVAFVDRADIKQYIGLPSAAAIFKIYLSCLEELMKCGLAVVVTGPSPDRRSGSMRPHVLESSIVITGTNMVATSTVTCVVSV